MAIQNLKENENNIDDNKKRTNENSDNGNEIGFDELLSSAGEMGRYQIFLSLGTFPFYVFGVFVYYSQMFMTEVSPNHWCWIPELANLSDIERRNLAIPRNITEKYGYSQCFSYAANWTQILTTGIKPNKTWSTVPCQNGWEFNKTEIPYPTISSDLGWVCDKGSYQANAQSIFFLGSTLGGIILGLVADKYGRVAVIVASNMLGCIGGLTSTFARNFAEFAVCRFIMGMAFDNCIIMVYLLVLEYISPRYKTLISNGSFGVFYSVTVIVLPWIALACGHWKTISLVTSVPLVLSVLAIFFLPESPRWLLSQGRIENTIEKIQMIGRINNKEISTELIEKFKIKALKEANQEILSFLEILKRPIMRKIFILICLEFICCTMVFDGLVRSIGHLQFDFFVSFTLVSTTELPSMLLLGFVSDWTGRRCITIICMTISCICCILVVLIGSALPSVICTIIARFSINMSLSANWQWAAELLPTSVRGSGVSIAYICGCIGTVLSPYVVYLNTYISWLPMIVIACIAGSGALIALLLPETANKKMPQTFEDAELLARNQKMWEVPCIQRQKSNANKDNVNGHVNDSFEMI